MSKQRRAPEKMDCTQLVQEVFARRALWQRNHKLHHNRSTLDHLWDEVADVVGSTRDGCRRRWKSLKDNFRRELKKTEETMFNSTWPHYDSLLFLKDQMISSFLADPLEIQPQLKFDGFDNSSNDVGINEDDIAVVEIEEDSKLVYNPIEPAPTAPATRGRRGRKRKHKPVEETETVPEIENVEEIIQVPQITHDIPRKENEYENSSETDDYFFFMSLIPHVQNFSSIQKLRLRNKIQQLIIDEASRINNTNNIH